MAPQNRSRILRTRLGTAGRTLDAEVLHNFRRLRLHELSRFKQHETTCTGSKRKRLVDVIDSPEQYAGDDEGQSQPTLKRLTPEMYLHRKLEARKARKDNVTSLVTRTASLKAHRRSHVYYGRIDKLSGSPAPRVRKMSGQARVAKDMIHVTDETPSLARTAQPFSKAHGQLLCSDHPVELDMVDEVRELNNMDLDDGSSYTLVETSAQLKPPPVQLQLSPLWLPREPVAPTDFAIPIRRHFLIFDEDEIDLERDDGLATGMEDEDIETLTNALSKLAIGVPEIHVKAVTEGVGSLAISDDAVQIPSDVSMVSVDSSMSASDSSTVTGWSDLLSSFIPSRPIQQFMNMVQPLAFYRSFGGTNSDTDISITGTAPRVNEEQQGSMPVPASQVENIPPNGSIVSCLVQQAVRNVVQPRAVHAFRRPLGMIDINTAPPAARVDQGKQRAVSPDSPTPGAAGIASAQVLQFEKHGPVATSTPVNRPVPRRHGVPPRRPWSPPLPPPLPPAELPPSPRARSPRPPTPPPPPWSPIPDEPDFDVLWDELFGDEPEEVAKMS